MPSPFPSSVQPPQQSQIIQNHQQSNNILSNNMQNNLNSPGNNPANLNPNLQYPALSLFPLNDTFIPKHIALTQRVKIGRQTNAKTVPGERNGYFDSKVLSRQHAEVWEDNGKIFIKDVKSSNGTFINGERLSQEGAESDPWELKSDDVVEFGIDIVGEDNKTIVHHKVAARVTCIMTADDAVREQQQMAAAVAAHHQQQQQHQQHFSQHQPAPPTRKPALQPSLGGMGGPSRPRSTISFDLILSRLQGELNKSRETTAELHGLSDAMNDINDSLGGAVPPPSMPSVLPPVRSSPTNGQRVHSPPNGFAPSEISELHSQLSDTQSSLATHAEKMREVEGVLSEHESIKREMAMLRKMLMERDIRDGSSSHGMLHPLDNEADDDDARSMTTVVPVEDDEDDDEERSRRREELGRPGTPEPGMNMVEEDENGTRRSRSRSPSRSPPTYPSSIEDSRLSNLASQLESAIELSRSLAAQHAAAQETIRHLEEKVLQFDAMGERVAKLETAVQQSVQAAPPSNVEFESKIFDMLGSWKEDMDGKWNGLREDWDAERRRLLEARAEYDKRVGGLEEGLGNMGLRVDSLHQAAAAVAVAAGSSRSEFAVGRHGLVTPPSPRSASADSSRRRKGRNKAKRRVSRDSFSDSDVAGRDADLTLESAAPRMKSENDLVSLRSLRRQSTRSSSPSPASSTAFEEDLTASLPNGHMKHGLAPLTPESSILHERQKPHKLTIHSYDRSADITASTMLGCVIVGAAAMAVYWRTHE